MIDNPAIHRHPSGDVDIAIPPSRTTHDTPPAPAAGDRGADGTTDHRQPVAAR